MICVLLLLYDTVASQASPSSAVEQPVAQSTSTPVRIVVERGTNARTDFEEGVPILLSELGSTRDVNKEVSHLLSKLSFAYEFVYFQDKCFANLFIKFAPNTLKIVPFKFD